MVFTTRSFDDAPDGAFPINFSGFTDMVHEGDTIFLGRYLVTGADESSLFLTVRHESGPGSRTGSGSGSLKAGLEWTLPWI